MEIKKKKHVGAYAIIKKDGEVLLIRKSRGAYKGKLDLPGGSIEYNETVEDALKREILEETGLTIKSYKLRKVITHYEIWNINEELQEDLSHYGIIFDCEIDNNEINNNKKDADGLDSLGSAWYKINDLKKEDLSPLAETILES